MLLSEVTALWLWVKSECIEEVLCKARTKILALFFSENVTSLNTAGWEQEGQLLAGRLCNVRPEHEVDERLETT